MNQKVIKNFCYITHIANVPSILENGILSHHSIIKEGILYTPIYDASIVTSRREKHVPEGKSLWTFANLYFQPRNPMLYRIKLERPLRQLVVLSVRPDVLEFPNTYITTGNAASGATEIVPVKSGMGLLKQIKKDVNKVYWTEESGAKRKIMAEVLVPDRVPPDMIDTIYVANHAIKIKVEPLVEKYGLPVTPEPYMFFEPYRIQPVAENLVVVEGDMFFSGLQTLTISVNTVGVMGKGLASRAKYQFPDAYVIYQDVCRKRTLQMGKPYLYKRETSFDAELAAEPHSLSHVNRETWFLFFPTKEHWKEKSNINGIEEGLAWIRDNYEKLGMTSLAVPALGCGLGQLSWEDVGPLMVKYLSIDIPVRIHLPMEDKVPDKFITREFLLGK